jgi:hypothetical protein
VTARVRCRHLAALTNALATNSAALVLDLLPADGSMLWATTRLADRADVEAQRLADQLAVTA